MKSIYDLEDSLKYLEEHIEKAENSTTNESTKSHLSSAQFYINASKRHLAEARGIHAMWEVLFAVSLFIITAISFATWGDTDIINIFLMFSEASISEIAIGAACWIFLLVIGIGIFILIVFCTSMHMTVNWEKHRLRYFIMICFIVTILLAIYHHFVF